MRISAAVAEVLLPILNDIKTDLNNLNELYSNLNATVSNLEETVSNLNKTVEDQKRQTTSEHTSLETSINNPPTNVIANAVLVKLLPYLNNIDEKIDESTNSLSEDLSSLNGSITDLTEKVCNVSDSQIEIAQDMNETINTHMEHLNMKLISINASMRQEHRDIGDELEQHNNHVTSELIELEIDHNTTYSKLDLLDTKQDELNMKVMSVSSDLEQNILSNVTKELKKTQDFLDAYLCGYTCGGEGGWRRVVYLDMTDPNTYCPSGWRLIEFPKRTCGALSFSTLSCDSVFFPVTGGDYNRVCGRIRSYQDGYIDAFEAYDEGHVTTIDEAYVAGVSLTHGSPRQHIWTFAAGISEAEPTRNDACPCDATISISIPPFVGGDYFCESGRNSSYRPSFAEADPLWDGKTVLALVHVVK